MDPDALRAFFAEHFPHASSLGFVIEAVGPEGAEPTLDTGREHLRPGGTVAGPTLMALLARMGPAAGPGVTSSLEMHFLRRPEPGRLRVGCRLLKVGRRLAVGAVDLHGPDGALVAHPTVTYALPDP